jgi:hypothetical protein
VPQGFGQCPFFRPFAQVTIGWSARPDVLRRGEPMLDNLEPSLLPLALLSWPLARSAVFVAAAAVNLWSRKPARRAEARRLLRLLARSNDRDPMR